MLNNIEMLIAASSSVVESMAETTIPGVWKAPANLYEGEIDFASGLKFNYNKQQEG